MSFLSQSAPYLFICKKIIFMLGAVFILLLPMHLYSNEAKDVVQEVCETNELEISGNPFFCSGASTILTAHHYVSYRWNDGTVGASIEVVTPGLYTVTGTAASGCTSTMSIQVREHSLPTISITGGNTTICEGNSVTLIANTTNTESVRWNTGSENLWLQVIETGTYTATATSSNGCTAQATATVIVNPSPVVTIVGDTNLCTGSSGELRVESNEAFLSYYWLTTGNPTAPVISIAPTTNTAYSVRVTNGNGCSATETQIVHVRQLPIPTISGNDYFCEGESLTLTAQANAPFVWNDGTTLEDKTVTTGGTYTVTATTEYGCIATASKAVDEAPAPIISIIGVPEFCEEESTTLTATGAQQYEWSTGAMESTITIDAEGSYTVTGTSSLGCATVHNFNVIENPLPVISIDAGTQQFCENKNLLLEAISTGTLNYSWNNGAQSAENLIDEPGVYTVTGTDAHGCSASASTTITTLPLPSITISADTNICIGEHSTLTASGGESYLWSTTSTQTSIIVTPTTTNTYTVVGTDGNGCSDSAQATVAVLPVPTVEITGDTIICFGDSTLLTTTSSAEILWSTGSQEEDIYASQAGVYSVTLTNSDGCSASSSIKVTVNPIPLTTIFGLTTICEENSTTLTVADGSLSYLWSTGSGAQAITVTPLDTTTYYCDVTNGYGCTSRIMKTVDVKPLPIPHIEAPQYLCEDSTTTIVASGGESYIWSSGEEVAEIEISNAGFFTVYVTSNGCQTNTTVQVEGAPNPIVTISGENTLCDGDSLVLTAHGAANYAWSNSEETTSITIHNAGNFNVTGTNAFGCSATATQIVARLIPPQFTITGESGICQGESVTLTVPEGNDYIWSNDSTTLSITETPTTNTTYEVTGTAPNGCVTLVTKNVAVWNTYYTTYSDSVCQDATYTKYGFNLPAQETAGTFQYFQNLTTQKGCDSIIELNLKVRPKPVFVSEIQGASTITEFGTFTYTIANAQHANNQYEWHINNPFWEFTTTPIANVAHLVVDAYGSGILTVHAFNSCGSSSKTKSIVASSVGISEHQALEAVVLYPNPTNNELNIDIENENITISHFMIYDITGKMVIQDRYNGAPISVGLLENGTYFIQLFNDGVTLGSLKFVKN